MMAWTWPAAISSLMPRRMSRPPPRTCRFSMLSNGLSNTALQRDAQQLLGLDREFHRQLAEHFAAESADDHVDCVLRRQAALPAIENLIFANLRRRRFVLHARGRVLDVEVRKRVRAALVADEQRIALRVVARALGTLRDLHQTAVGVLPVAGRDALRDG